MNEYIVKDDGNGFVEQVGELIRCKDCKHFNNLLYTHCPQSGMNVTGYDNHCSWAERKEE